MAEIEKVIKDLVALEDTYERIGNPIVASLMRNTIYAIRELQNENAELHDSIQALNIFHQETLEQIPKWHYVADNDFPTNDDNRFYVCISENHEEDIPTMFQYDSELGFGWWHDIYDQHTLGFVDSEFHTVEEEHLEKVIAWFELPKF